MAKSGPTKLADKVCAAYGSHVSDREKEFSRHGFMAGYNAGVRRGRVSRRKAIAVMDRVFEAGGYRLTVRAYNAILTGLGYKLDRQAQVR